MNKYRKAYNEELHDMHGRDWTLEDLIYLCSMYEYKRKADLALALGRTHAAVLGKVYMLKKEGRYEKYKKMGNDQ